MTEIIINKPGKKITLATLKSFIKRYSNKLYINELSVFDGMIDGLKSCNEGFKPASNNSRYNSFNHDLGYAGIYLVLDSRDYFETYENEIFKGIEVYNSCGNFIVAVKKGDF